jgi:3-hydroxyisobutyrate dehydrogenase
MSEQTVAVLGAGGTMGKPMARNLAQAGFAVRAWNRSTEKAQSLADDGAEVVGSSEEAGRGADVILTMLADTDAVLDSVGPALAAAGGDVLWLQMSTLGEHGTERCIQLVREQEVAFLDAPVLGTKQPAHEGKLVVLASGDEGLRDRVQPIFDAVGQKTLWVGGAGAGTRLKLVANSWVLTVVEGCAETIALAQGLDVDPSHFFDALEGGALDLPYLRMKGKAILDGDFDPMFSLKLAAKDARLVDESAGAHGMDLPLFHTIAQRMTQGAQAHGDEDMSATYFASAPEGSGQS